MVQEVAAEIRAFGSARDIQPLADLPSPIIFLATGLPFALIALLFLRRGGKLKATAAALDPNSAIRRQALLVSALALLFAIFLWNIRAAPGQAPTDFVTATLSPLLWPVRLFVTFVHEAGHSLAALLTGGEVIGFTVSPDGSGLATTRGGYNALILPAGYLGAALFGSALYFLTIRYPKWTRALSVLLGLSFIVLTVLFSQRDESGYITVQLVGIGFGIGMVALGWLAPRIINVFILNTLAILTGLNAAMDILTLISYSYSCSDEVLNDAAAFSCNITPLLPASVIAFIWSAIAVVMLGAAVYFGLVKQVGGEISDAVKSANGKTA
ncbi:MAG: M50 family metallopeptidase [Chloroflexi bacterium]|nr:M50 family metallopeptidase [Chloroflexota bacterium]